MGKKVDNILTTFYMYFYVSKCTEMHFCENKKALENIRKSNIFKGFLFSREGEFKSLCFLFGYKGLLVV